MGVFKDEYLIFKSFEKEPLEKLRQVIIKAIYDESLEWNERISFERLSNYVPPVIRALANDSYILFWPADGSKEGWSTSSIVAEAREYVVEEYLDIWNYNQENFMTKIRYIYLEDCDFHGLKASNRFLNDEI